MSPAHGSKEHTQSQACIESSKTQCEDRGIAVKQAIKQSIRQLIGMGVRQQSPSVLCLELLISDVCSGAFSEAASIGGSQLQRTA